MNTTNNVAIKFENITKTFGSVIANKNISFEVNKGEILSLLGENGSGKTTLMNMISGIYFPDSGNIYIDGKSVKDEPLECNPGERFVYGLSSDTFWKSETEIRGTVTDCGTKEARRVICRRTSCCRRKEAERKTVENFITNFCKHYL